MFVDYKNFIYTNILALAGYPAIWGLYWFLFCIKNPVGGGDILGFIIFPISIIYCYCVITLAISAFFIEKSLLKFNKKSFVHKFSDNIYYNIYLHIGLILFFLLCIPILTMLFLYFLNDAPKYLILILITIILWKLYKQKNNKHSG